MEQRSSKKPKPPLSSTHPKHVYHPDGRWASARDESQEDQLREAGFTLNAPVPVMAVEAVSDEVKIDRLRSHAANLSAALEAQEKASQQVIDDCLRQLALQDQAIARLTHASESHPQIQADASRSAADLAHANSRIEQLTAENETLRQQIEKDSEPEKPAKAKR